LIQLSLTQSELEYVGTAKSMPFVSSISRGKRQTVPASPAASSPSPEELVARLSDELRAVVHDVVLMVGDDWESADLVLLSMHQLKS